MKLSKKLPPYENKERPYNETQQVATYTEIEATTSPFVLIKSHDIIEKLPQRIKVPQHKTDYLHNKIENLHNIIKTQQIIME